jgi:penicillin-binding protein 2
MSERPRVLVELGDELDRVARSVLPGRRRRLVAPYLGTALAALAAVAAVAIATVAILVVGHRLPASGAAGSRRPGVSVPRGAIVDRHGRVLVGTRRAIDVQIVPTRLPVPVGGGRLATLTVPPAADQAVYDRLASALGISIRRRACVLPRHAAQLTEIACDVAHALYGLRSDNVTVASDLEPSTARAVTGGLPGVTTANVYLPTYPYRGLAAQVLGSVGRITASELRAPQFAGVPANAVVGQTGLEYFYDRYLRGRDTLTTSLDLGLERAAQSSLATSIARNAPGRAGAGAFVVMNPQNGQVLAMGSLPSYDPSIFTKPISQSKYQQLIRAKSNAPLEDRATDGVYPTGSTFKPITAAAALMSGTWHLGDTYDNTGQYCLPPGGMCVHNADNVANGVLDLVSALRVSDDVFFYNLGAKLNVDPAAHPLGGALQEWARLFGIGQATGVDLPYEASGNLPDPKWRTAISRVELQYEQHHHAGCCTIALPGPWTVGDNINLAVGQGDLLVTPLQLAVAYAAIANGGMIVRPHIGLQVENNVGDKVLQKIDPPPTRHITIDPTYLDAIRTGLRESASAPGGTSSPVMGAFPKPVYGATGTAQHVGRTDQAWYAGYVPATATSKPVVVVVTVEKGGFGAVAAAPVARQILSQWFLGRPGAYIPGSSKTR